MKNAFICQFKLNETIHESYAYHNLKKKCMPISAVTQHFEHLLTPDKILKHDFDGYFLKFLDIKQFKVRYKGLFKEHFPVEESNLCRY